MKRLTHSGILMLGLCLGGMMQSCSTTDSNSTIQPTPGQQAMIDRKYGMFLHFGMNTYLNAEWSDGTAAAGVYAPPADIAEQAAGWVRNAKRPACVRLFLTTSITTDFVCGIVSIPIMTLPIRLSSIRWIL